MTEECINDFNVPSENGGFERDWDLWRAQMSSVVSNLEEKYADRKLKFSMSFLGSVPVQAFGTIDNMIFYFRYRGDYGQLRVGFVAEDRFEKEHERDLMYWEERVEKSEKEKEESSEIPSEDLLDTYWEELYLRKPVQQVSDNETMPTSIRKISSAVDYLDDPYNGTLTPKQCGELFTLLVDTLEDIVWEEPIYPEGVEQELRAKRLVRFGKKTDGS